MSDFLDRLRREPPRKRRLIAAGVSGGIVAIIFVVWATTFVTSLSTKNAATATASSTDQNAASSINAIAGQLETFIPGIMDVIRQFNIQLASSTATTSPEDLASPGIVGAGPEATSTTEAPPGVDATSSGQETPFGN